MGSRKQDCLWFGILKVTTTSLKHALMRSSIFGYHIPSDLTLNFPKRVVVC